MKATPVSIAEYRRTSCRYSVSRKNCANAVAPIVSISRVCRGERPQAEDPQRQQRCRGACLDPDERRDQRGGGREQPDRDAVAPAMLASPRDCVDQHHQAGRDRDGAGDVEVPACERGPALAHQPRGDGEDGRADRQVDEEDPRPAQVRGEDAAEQHTDGAAAAGGSTPYAEGDVPLTPLAEGGDDDRERGRGEQCAAEALQRPG